MKRFATSLPEIPPRTALYRRCRISKSPLSCTQMPQTALSERCWPSGTNNWMESNIATHHVHRQEIGLHTEELLRPRARSNGNRVGSTTVQEVPTVHCDHQSLTSLLTLPQTGKLARWQEFLSTSDFKIDYVPGKLNVVTDTFSRIEFYSKTTALIAVL